VLHSTTEASSQRSHWAGECVCLPASSLPMQSYVLRTLGLDRKATALATWSSRTGSSTTGAALLTAELSVLSVAAWSSSAAAAVASIAMAEHLHALPGQGLAASCSQRRRDDPTL